MKVRHSILALAGAFSSGFFAGIYQPRLASAKTLAVSENIKSAESVKSGALSTPTGSSDNDSIRALFDEKDYSLLEQLLWELGRRSPLAGLKNCEVLPMPARLTAQRIILGSWIRSDFAEAFRWARDHDPLYFSTKDFAQISADTGNLQSVLDATSFVSGIGERQMMVGNIVSEWATRKELSFSLKQFMSTLSGQLSFAANLSYYEVAGRQDHAEALNSLSNYDGSRDELSSLIAATVKGWIKNEGLGPAMDYLSARPVARELNPSYSAVAVALVDSDPVQSIVWLKKIEDPNYLEAATIKPAALLAYKRPELAVQLLVENTKEGQALESRIQVPFENWYSSSPEAALQFLNTTTKLPVALKQALKAHLNVPNE